MEAVNYDRGVKSKSKLSYTNCARCTAAYDLRRRGFEVSSTAQPKNDKGGTSKADMESWYKNGKFTEFDISEWGDGDGKKTSSQIIREELSKQPEGSRGNLCFFWPFGGGHSVAWEIKDGNLIILDTQANEKYEDSKIDELLEFAAIEDAFNHRSVYMRTDNLEPNYEVLKKKGIIQ